MHKVSPSYWAQRLSSCTQLLAHSRHKRLLSCTCIAPSRTGGSDSACPQRGTGNELQVQPSAPSVAMTPGCALPIMLQRDHVDRLPSTSPVEKLYRYMWRRKVGAACPRIAEAAQTLVLAMLTRTTGLCRHAHQRVMRIC